ncbi:MAG TPA: DNA polymerase/3'-5' exonuclease PolX, partial [Armatimonadota bacterium]|nr:DNA polymerase/3'-5' exonuclease PolX [Armatimonadota bacterium]
MDNSDVVRIMDEVGDILEIIGEDAFKFRSYRRAAESIRGLPDDLATIREGDGLTSIPRVGKSLAAKIEELLDDGTMEYHEELKSQVPDGLLDMLKIQGIGPKKVSLFWKESGIRNVDELQAAAEAEELRKLAGMGAKSEEKILRGIALFREGDERARLGDVLPIAEAIVEALDALPETLTVTYAGSTRRMRETVGDLDILATSESPEVVMEAFKALPEIREIMLSGETKTSAILEVGRQVDLRVVPPESYGAALLYFTGSKNHNIALRERARRMSLTVNEYAVSRLTDEGEAGESVAGATEEDCYAALDVAWIPPEIREDHGEVQAAVAGELPDLVEPGDIRCDLQMHSEWSDGTHTVAQMAESCMARGYDYMAISDHSQSLQVAHGLAPGKLAAQHAEVGDLNATLDDAGKGFRVLHANEVDIKSDGSLDYEPDELAALDLVLGSMHQGFADDRDRMTRRIVTALETGMVDILCHPTGRLILKREGYPVDMEAIVEAAAEFDVALEVNAFPQRLDLCDVHVRLAMERGVKISI